MIVDLVNQRSEEMKNRTVYKIREFNRFYMPTFSLLGNSYLGSEYSAAEARVFYEVYENDGCNASHIAKTMNIDKSYLSRILKSHEKKGYITKTLSQKDCRAYDLHLTELGRRHTEDLIERSNQQINEVISCLEAEDCEQLISAIQTITDILGKCRGAV